MICCLTGRERPLRDAEALIARACREGGQLRVIYDAGIDLAHYGEVDQLAPAGSMAEFVDYVSRQGREEVEESLAPLYAAARRHALPLESHVVFGRDAVEKLLRRWRRHGPLTVLGAD